MSFDADTFMNTAADAGSTELPKTPEGEFRVVIGQMTSENFKTLQVDDKNNPGQKRNAPTLSVPFIIRDQDVNKTTGRDTIVHYETFWLDFTPEGKLDMSDGKNVKLNQLREVLSQNAPGWTPAHLSNAGPLMIAVKHSPGKAGTANEGKTFVNIAKFAKIS